MAIFPKLILEAKAQVDDKTRLDGTTTFISTDEAAISLVEIEPEDSSGFIAVTSDKYLDWSYATAGDKVVSIRVTTDGSPETSTKTITVVTEATDKLFSSDAELVPHEPDIMNYLPEGKNSYLNIHRLAQDRILTSLDEKRIWDNDGNRLTSADIVDTEEVNDWSKYLTLTYIFEGLSNDIGDIFHEKALRYRNMAKKAASRGVLRLDLNNDGTISSSEKADVRSMTLLRR